MSNRNKKQLAKEQLIDLASDNQDIYKSAYDWFMQQGLDITDALVEGLDDSGLGSVCHWRILLLLRYFANEETLPAILKALRLALDRRDFIVLPGAMEALAVFRTPETTSALVALLKESNLDIVKQAAALLGKTGDLNAVEPLLRLLDSDNPSIRYSAVRGLTQLNYPSVRGALELHLEKEADPEVRELIESSGIRPPNESD